MATTLVLYSPQRTWGVGQQILHTVRLWLQEMLRRRHPRSDCLVIHESPGPIARLVVASGPAARPLPFDPGIWMHRHLGRARSGERHAWGGGALLCYAAPDKRPIVDCAACPVAARRTRAPRRGGLMRQPRRSGDHCDSPDRISQTRRDRHGPDLELGKGRARGWPGRCLRAENAAHRGAARDA